MPERSLCQCVAFDTAVCFIQGIYRCCFTATDHAGQQGWRHCYNYPKYPKINAYNEHLNRTVQEEFGDHQKGLLLDDL